MNEQHTAALLDAHDSLVAACLAGQLSLVEFLAAYDGFPQRYDLGRRPPGDEVGSPELFRKRIAFHAEVAKIVSVATSHGEAGEAGEELDRFLARVIVERIRQIVARYPHFEASSSGRTFR